MEQIATHKKDADFADFCEHKKDAYCQICQSLKRSRTKPDIHDTLKKDRPD